MLAFLPTFVLTLLHPEIAQKHNNARDIVTFAIALVCYFYTLSIAILPELVFFNFFEEIGGTGFGDGTEIAF